MNIRVMVDPLLFLKTRVNKYFQPHLNSLIFK